MALCIAMLATPAVAAEIWFAGVDPYGQPDNPIGAAFMDLFKPDAQWTAAADLIQVFKVSTQFLHRAPDAELSHVINGLKDRHIALAMEGLLLPESERCGRGVEGYSGAGVMRQIADRVQRLSGRIDYVAMDEPVWFGHHEAGPRLCQDSVAALARQLAPNVRILKAAFPGITFGDIEPVNARSVGDIADILEFAGAFRVATGEPLAFVHADIIWQQDWRPQLVKWRERLHAAGMRFGVIFDGDPQDEIDTAWTDHAVARYRSAVADPLTRPDHAIIQSWMPHPARMLPNSAPGTLTSVVVETLGRK